ncbi:hypothetical protein SEA_CREWMATE_39 [Arthrobacter phage Crewmate]|uniref:Uncharacterized protein n=1 Tax=Arthrobacter phage Crewmate TaxID=2832317 RepID=A0AA49B3Y4_9CAUD|nr:hypothetical protein PQE17_gp39 [Arthrobacter phage Crewmate]UIW13291.1 hypothetical protein SEA_CREWMATE_39 [Arthrobacter phage Crewmate]WGH21214.1 hypothetical protein SEA_OBITOO_38 [Arthrobacter phage ObiToo]
MSARGSRETRAHYFDAPSLTELGQDVDDFLAGGTEDGWAVESVDVDSDVRMIRGYDGPWRVSIRYSATVTLARHRA